MSALMKKEYGEQIENVKKEKNVLTAGSGDGSQPCTGNEDYDMDLLWNADEDIRSLKSLILFGLRGMAAYALPCDGAGIF